MLLDDVLSGGAPSEPVVEETPPLQVKRQGLYVVEPGDSLWSIAVAQKIEWADLLKWNDLQPTSFVYPGQMLSVHAPPDRCLLCA